MARHKFFSYILLGIIMAATTSLAGRTDRGTVELGISGMLDFQTANGTYYDLELAGGYFFMDGVLFGTKVGFSDDDRHTHFSALGFIEQHFETGRAWIPYAGGQAGIIYASTGSPSDSTTVAAVGAIGGIKYYLTEQIALDCSLNGLLASDDIFPKKNGETNVDLTIKLGLRFFVF
jgi:hypothetical protein